MAEEEKVEAPKTNGAASPIVIKLRKSVIANGDEVTELSFREPTGGDIEAVGNPVIIDQLSNIISGEQPRTTFDTKSMTLMMARLAMVPPSTIRQVHPKDWNTIAWNLANFFTPEW
jgi:hypothetical protein